MEDAMSKIYSQPLSPQMIRGFFRRLFYLSAATTLLMTTLDASILLGGGQEVGTPFLPAMFGATGTVFSALLLHGTRHWQKNEES
jgi:hypothetical protein